MFTRGLAGFLLDRYHLAALKLENPHSVTKFHLLRAAAARTHARHLVEIGTCLGITARRCARIFESVHTVELDPTLANQAREWLRDLHNVKVIEGDGLVVLPDILRGSTLSDVMIFLDGHFSRGATACGPDPEPAVKELAVLQPFVAQIAGIVIDDFRCFGTAGFPTKSDLFQAAEQFALVGYDLDVRYDQLTLLRSPKL